MSPPEVYVFWDNSNIFISAKDLAENRDGWWAREEVRIHFQNLFHLACAGRPIGRALAAGSIPPEYRELWDRFKASGVEVQLLERGEQTHKEQAVDALLQVAMLRTLADTQPQVAVLLTGDGAGYDDGVGFHADLERMEKKGWGIEVIAWDFSCRRGLKDWAQQVGVYIPLDDYYESVTFIEDGRRSSPLNLTHRPKSTPRDYNPVKERRRERALERSRRATQAASKGKKKSKKRRR